MPSSVLSLTWSITCTQYMAPEVIICQYAGQHIYDKRCDIYSFAILVWEIYHNQAPVPSTPMLLFSWLQ